MERGAEPRNLIAHSRSHGRSPFRREKLNEGVTCTADTHKAVEGDVTPWAKESATESAKESSFEVSDGEGKLCTSAVRPVPRSNRWELPSPRNRLSPCHKPVGGLWKIRALIRSRLPGGTNMIWSFPQTIDLVVIIMQRTWVSVDEHLHVSRSWRPIVGGDHAGPPLGIW